MPHIFSGYITVEGNGAKQSDWKSFTERTQSDRTPSPHTDALIELIKSGEIASPTSLLDIGTGTGRSCLDLLEGSEITEVTAVDFDQNALLCLKERVNETITDREIFLEVVADDIVKIDSDGRTYDVVNGTSCFSYVGDGDVAAFVEGMHKILDLVAEGGVFTGDFFGNQIEWTDLGRGHNHIGLSQEDLKELLAEHSFEIIVLKEEVLSPTPYPDYVTTMHKISVVAVKRDS